MPPASAALDAFDLTGRVAIVTGASSGLGVRFAEVLAGAGATVVATARRADRLEALAARTPGVIAVPADLTEAGERERVVSATLERAGRCDVLVNNAGVGRAVPIEDESLEEFRRALEINLTAPWHLMKLAGEALAASGHGSVVNVASMLGLVASAPVRQAHYCASKGGLINLTREVAVQWARRGVRVNALAPGWFPSEMTAMMWDDESSMTFLRRNAPLARGGRPHELDAALLFLASDASSYMTGQVLVVDGGWTAR